LIEPHGSRPQGPPPLIKYTECLTLIGDCQCRDLPRVDLGEQLVERCLCRRPPVLRVLLPPARLRIGDGDWRTPLSVGAAVTVPGDRLGGRGRCIDSDDEIASHSDMFAKKTEAVLNRLRKSPGINQRRPASATALSMRLATLSMHFLASPP